MAARLPAALNDETATLEDDELLCEVDARDRVIGPRLRSEVHRLHLRHRSVHVLVFAPCGAVYLQRRSWRKAVSPGLWDTSAAGHVGFGETYRDAARRELAEELGLDRGELQCLGKLGAGPGTGFEFVRVYRLVTAEEPVPNPLEIEEGCWFRPTAIEDWIARGGTGLTQAFQAVWALARQAGY